MSRYIDADMLYVDWYDSFVTDDGTEYDNIPFISKSQIDDAPTIEPKRGEWIHPYHYGLALPEHQCSVCGEWENSDTESNFCPNCGADMREVYDE